MKHIRLSNLLKKLSEEEETLKEALAEIQKQINVLEIEQMHISSMACQNGVPHEPDPAETNSSTPKPLDLEIPRLMIKYEEEEEEEEEDEDDE